MAKDVIIGSAVEVVDAQPYNQSSTGAYSQMHSSLYDCVTGRDANYKLEPRIATSWTPLDATTWQFKLRPGVKFHNGDALTAADVKWSIEHTYDPAAKTIYATSFNTIARIDFVDDLTVNMITKKTDPFLPDKLSLRPGYVLPSKYFQTVGVEGFNAKPVGSGPYMFKERILGSSFKVVRNPTYWRGVPEADSLTALFRPDQASRIATLKNAEVNLITGVPYDQVDELNAHPLTKTLAVPSITVSKYAINTKVKPLDNKLIRHALSLAIDRPLLNRSLGKGLYAIANGPIPPGEYAYDPKLPPLAFDPTRAKALMQQAGYAKEKIPFEYNPEGSLRDQAVAEQWKAVGFNIEMVPMDAATRAKKIANPAAGFVGISWVGFSSKYADPDGMVWRTLQPGGSLRYWSLPEFDRLGVEQATSTDQALRLRIWQRMTAILLDEMPWVYLWVEPTIWGISKKIDIKPTIEENDDFGPGNLKFAR